MLHLDFETRSEADLKKVGAHLYAAHPSTVVLCASYSVDGETIRTWKPWLDEPLHAAIASLRHDDTLVHGWNVSFERMILRHKLGIDLPPSRFRDTQAQARSMALPPKLELTAKALEMPVQKGDSRLMLKWCKPLPKGGWANDPSEYLRLCKYCEQDVLAEMGIAKALRELTDDERLDWEINERINDRGLPIDLELVRAAQAYAMDERAEIDAQLNRLTNGQITGTRQFARIKDWLQGNGVFIEPDEDGKISVDAAKRAELLESEDLPDNVREIVALIDDGGKASTAKFAAMENRAGPDARVRGAYICNGAGQTGRYASTGAQLHNYIRAKLDNVEDVADAVIARVPKSRLVKLSGHNILTTLSRLLRPSIVADTGKTFVWGDWSAIEARVLPWLSDDMDTAKDVLMLFETGVDIYVRQAANTFMIGEDEVTEDERQIGKVQVLSLGFGGGKGAFKIMAKNYGIEVSDVDAEKYKRAWRGANPWAQVFWAKLEKAAYAATRSPGEVFSAGRVSYLLSHNTLWCLLPSGRLIAYPFAAVEEIEGQSVLTAMKGSFHPKRGESDWPRMKLWGGFLAENITQATAADMLRWSLRELFAAMWGDCVIGHTHDEIIMEVPDADVAQAKEVLADIMTTGPEWASGLPLAAKIESGVVYGK